MAARDYIKIDRTNAAAIHSSLALRYVRAVRDAWEANKLIQGIIDHNNDGSNFADVEALFGLPAGTGVTFQTLTSGAIKDADAKALTERVG